MMAPLLLFTRTDRAVWLLNFLPFLALPGLVFSTFVRAGVRPKVAFRWMWLIPSAYILAGQAGGSANDLPSAFFALAAIDFALRARQSGRCADVWFSALAMAVLTNWKVSNSPLGLVWLAAVWPALPLLAGKPFKSAAVAVAALLASTIPTAVLNQYYCGDWTGAKLDVPGKPSDRPPGLVLGTNLLNIAVRNLTPPLFPWASQWNRWSRSVQPESYRREVARIFGDRMEPTDVSELPDEERGNFGFGLTVLLIVGAIANLRSTNSIGPPRKFFWIWFTPWVALAVLLWNMPVDAVPRHIAGYYPLLALGIVAGRAQHLLIRRRWWNGLATLAYLSGFIPVVLAPTRPLWPAQTILGALVERYPHSVLLERARQTFQTYASRARVLDPIAKWIPEGEKVVGLVAHNQIETSLWRPFGERTIVHVPPSASREEILRRGIRVVVVHEITLQMMENFRYLDWLVQHQDMDLLGEAQIRTYSAAPAERWIVYRLRDGDRGSQ
jgi:hypothetical protein